MRTRSVLDVLCDGRRPEGVTFDSRTQANIKRQWIGEVVIAKYDKRCYSVVDILFDESPASLPVKDLGMSHAEYFSKRKGIKLEHPDARPIVVVSGRANNHIYLPAELICGNELDAQLKARLPSIASFTPDVKRRAIDEMRGYLIPGAQKGKGGRGGNRGGGGLLAALGFMLADELVKVKVTKLELPVITVAGMTVPSNMGGMWAPISESDAVHIHGTSMLVADICLCLYLTLGVCLPLNILSRSRKGQLQGQSPARSGDESRARWPPHD